LATEILSQLLPQQDDWLQALIQPPALSFSPTVASQPRVRLIRLDEINVEGHQAYRQALANVYASLDPTQPVRLLYLLDGSPSGIALYFGVTSDCADADLHEAMKNLRGALEGQLPGINFGEKVVQASSNALVEQFNNAAFQGVMLGAPTGQPHDESSDEQNFQGLDRLVRALQSGSRSDNQNDGHWQLAVTSQPLTRQQIRQHLDAAYALSSRLAALVRTSIQASGNTSQQKSVSSGTSDAKGVNDNRSESRSKNEGASESWSRGTSSSSNRQSSSNGSNSSESLGKNVGTSTSTTTGSGSSFTTSNSSNHSLSNTEGSNLGITQEIANKRAQHLVDYLDKQLINRLHKGLTKGLYHSALYFAAEDNTTYQRLKNTLRATYQGSEITMSPLEVYDLPRQAHGQFLRLPVMASPHPPEALLFHSLQGGSHGRLGSLLTADELAIIANLPQQELQGIRRRKTVNFAVDLPDVEQTAALDLGTVIDRGRRYPNNRVRLSRNDLNKHVFVTGVTGAGKTTTCLNLLLESGLPFLVIEPAKTEYRELAEHLGSHVDYYRPNGDDYQSLRLNPFALVRKNQRIKSHAGFLKNTFTAVFPMEASMPMMVEAAILAAYEDKGWDVDENEFLPGDDPFDPASRAWPTLSDMINQLDRLIPLYGLGRELEEKYRGSLVSRLRSLTDGTLGRVLDVPQSIDFHALLQRKAVVELEELQGGEEKALLMALLLGAINETMRSRHEQDPGFRQLTLIEEAHRLLSRPEHGDKAAAMAVESFAGMLAEVRKYGTGLIIADQIPAKLIPDVIKNTHCKIVHRLFAEDDRRSMAEAMMMDEEQRTFLPNLSTGEAIVFCGGWHGPAHAAIRNDRAQTDNRQVLDLQQRSEHQLWRERARYYPRFCQLGWLSEDQADSHRFACFVRETRQAHNQLLQLVAPGSRPQRADGAFLRLNEWLGRWQAAAVSGQAGYVQWREQQTFTWPNSLLAAAWMALMLDANPSVHANEKEVPSLLDHTERDTIALASDVLLRLLGESTDLAMLKQKMQLPDARDLFTHCKHLSRFKTF
jgi:hypothetical protein